MTTRQRCVLAVVLAALMMSSIDSTIVATALPALHDALGASLSTVGWSLTGYTLGQVVIAPLAGYLGDAYGRGPVFLLAVVVFVVSSLLCGFVTSVYELIPLRVVQAFGGGAFIPSAIGIISETFTAGRERARAVGLTSSVLPAGGLIGPAVGALLISTLSWRWIFFLNVPVGLVLLLLALRLVPRARRAANSTRLDIVGVLLLAALMLAIMVATTALSGGRSLLDRAVVAVAVVAIGFSAWAIARHSGRVANPLIPMRFVTGPGFRLINLINVVYGACVLGLATLLPLYAQDRYGLSLLASGSLLTARALSSILVAAVAAFLLERTGYRAPIFIGLFGIAAGFLLTAIPAPGMPALPWLVLSTAITGIGFGLSAPATNNAALALAPESVGTVTGLRGVGRQAGAILAVSVATSVASLAHQASLALATVFATAAVLVFATLPLILRLAEDPAEPSS